MRRTRGILLDADAKVMKFWITFPLSMVKCFVNVSIFQLLLWLESIDCLSLHRFNFSEIWNRNRNQKKRV